jgi:hypothetical protein
MGIARCVGVDGLDRAFIAGRAGCKTHGLSSWGLLLMEQDPGPLCIGAGSGLGNGHTEKRGLP